MQLIAIIFAFAAMVGLVLADFHYADMAEPNDHNAMVRKDTCLTQSLALMYCLQRFHVL
jgi:hypothetical protein